MLGSSYRKVVGRETDSLEHLLPADVVQPRVEVLDARGNVLELVLVAALDLVGLADDEVEPHLDAAVGDARGEPPGAARARGRHEADLVVAGFLGGEGEAAGGLATLGDDAVVVVKDLLRRALACLWGWNTGQGRLGQDVRPRK